MKSNNRKDTKMVNITSGVPRKAFQIIRKW